MNTRDRSYLALAVIVLVLMAACATKTPVSTSLPESTPSELPSKTPPVAGNQDSANKLGIHLLLDDGRNSWPVDAWPEHMGYARNLVGEWGFVTELVRSDDLDPERWQTFLDLCGTLHLTPILRLATTYDRENNWWEAPEPDADETFQSISRQYAAFIGALHWPDSDAYVVIGNEPNHGNEWGGRPDPAAYARFLIDVSNAIHQERPAIKVVNAGFDPYTPHTGGLPFVDGQQYMDEETFLDGMVAAYPDVFNLLDAWATHAYPLGPLTEPPWQQTYQVDWLNGFVNPGHTSPPPNVNNRGINGYEWELFKLASFGIEELPVLITETGWRHQETTDPGATDNGRPLPDAKTVAIYFDLALQGNNGRYPQYPEAGWKAWLYDQRVIAVTPFALNGYPGEWGHSNWLQINERGKVLGVYAPYDRVGKIDLTPDQSD